MYITIDGKALKMERYFKAAIIMEKQARDDLRRSVDRVEAGFGSTNDKIAAIYALAYTRHIEKLCICRTDLRRLKELLGQDTYTDEESRELCRLRAVRENFEKEQSEYSPILRMVPEYKDRLRELFNDLAKAEGGELRPWYKKLLASL